MKTTITVLLSILCLACGPSRPRRLIQPQSTLSCPDSPDGWCRPTEPAGEIFSYYNEAMDMTLLITEIKSVRYRVQPPAGNPTAGAFVSMSAVHLTNRLTQTPDVVSFNITTAVDDVPPKLLLLNIGNGRWIRVEPEVVNGVFVAVIPLTSMETFLDAEQNGVVGFMGDDRRFVQFAVNNSALQLFKRFMNRLHQTQPQDPDHHRDSNLPHK